MPILRPSALGGVISAIDSNSLSTEFNVNDPVFGSVPVGTKVWNVDVGSYFTLTVSSASLVTDQVLAVLNYDGLRWIKTPDGTVTGVTGQTANAVNNTDPNAPVINDATPSNAGTLSSTDKTKLDKVLYLPKVATALTDADATVQPFSTHSGIYVLPSNTLTQNRVLTLGNTGQGTPTLGVRVIVMPQTHDYVIHAADASTLFTYTANDPATIFFVVNTGSGNFQASTREFVEVTA